MPPCMSGYVSALAETPLLTKESSSLSADYVGWGGESNSRERSNQPRHAKRHAHRNPTAKRFSSTNKWIDQSSFHLKRPLAP